LGIGRLKEPAVLGVITVSAVESRVASYSTITRTVEAAFSNAGGSLWTLDRWRSGTSDPMPMDEALRMMSSNNVSALIVVGILGPVEHGDRVLENIDLHRTPTVFITWDVPSAALPHVYYDNMNAGFVAAEHLVRQGYRRLFFLPSGPENQTAAKRIRGARQATLATGGGVMLEVVRPDRSSTGAPRADVGYNLAAECIGKRRVLEKEDGPVAFIAFNDAVASGVMKYATEHGLAPGRDVGVIGFDDDVADSALGLSSVRPALEEMGQNAVRMIVDMLNGDPTHFQVCCSSQVIARRSTNRRAAI
jgi:DNA-binding LacI/PurR family transcriptional regulator